MDDVNKMLVKQFLLRVRQEGFSIIENPPYSVASELNIDIYRGKTKICTFDDRLLGAKWKLRITTYDSTDTLIKDDYYKLHRMLIGLRDLYMIYDAAVPLKGYDHSLGYREIMQYNNCVLAVHSDPLGELEFGTFRVGESNYSYGHY